VESCDLRDSCFFYNKQEKDMPHTVDYLIKLYCFGNRCKECVLHKIAESCGVDNVPKYLYPNDMHEILNFNLVARQEGLDMFLKVVYPDGSSGFERSTVIGQLSKSYKIVAYLCSEGWIEVRRKQKDKNYSGPERRRSNFAST
jgi:hypothetical protein